MLRNISERYARGLGAAIVAVAVLLLASNAVPAKADDAGRAEHVQHVHDAGR
ncbi:hypothetical protein [Streptomyces gilvus]|uniref:hypothetical protein n=1 Tax=Streptomyces gilvus TaxID=2920937 RepID=UPI001F0ED636|nr:hypothetical protein [Streptomyces sp. CME 23]MCH5672494.1 hypothetical protein [Streptomyces sp. CME 23]